MLSDTMQDFIRGLPKAELHLHIEGTLSPQTLLRLAERNDLSFPYQSVAGIEEALANRPAGLDGFLDHHYIAVSTMQTQRDFQEVTYELLKALQANNVLYAELFFDPQFHTSRGIAFEAVMDGILEGRLAGERDFDVASNLIMCINRERSVPSAFAMLEQAKPYQSQIIGLGMDSYEEHNFPQKFKQVYEQARREGYRLTSHCDVDQPNSVQHIWDCLNLLQVERIDHGVNALEDPALVQALIERNICLTTCPVRRPTDPEPQDIARIKQLFEQGVCVTLNTDDPAEFNTGYLTNLLIEVQAASHYSRRDLVRFMLNAFDGSWLAQQQKDGYVDRLLAYAVSCGVIV
ncbi:MAG: adenosine deaminase [Chloroflexota bacterium]